MSSCKHHASMLENGSQEDVHAKRFVRHTKLDGIIMIQQK